MKKNIIILLVLIVAGGIAWSVYYNSTQRPNDVPVASDVLAPTPSQISGSTDTEVINDIAWASGVFNAISWSTLWRKWTKVWWAHTGTIGIQDWSLSLSSGMIVSWSFVLDMGSIQLLDIDNEKFENEIKNDFFEATTFPTSKIEIVSVSESNGQFVANATLTIKDISEPISFPFSLVKDTTNNTLQAKANFAIDRNKRNLTMRKGMVNDFIEYNIDITLAQ